MMKEGWRNGYTLLFAASGAVGFEKNVTPQSRNERLAALFYRLKLIEAYGTGISKIISSYKKTGVEPIFENV